MLSKGPNSIIFAAYIKTLTTVLQCKLADHYFIFMIIFVKCLRKRCLDIIRFGDTNTCAFVFHVGSLKKL